MPVGKTSAPYKPAALHRKLCILIVHSDRLLRQALQERFDQQSSLTYSVEMTDSSDHALELVYTLQRSRLNVALVLIEDRLAQPDFAHFGQQLDAIDPQLRKLVILTQNPTAANLALWSDVTHFDGFLHEPEADPKLIDRIARSVERYTHSLEQHRRLELYTNLHRSGERLLDQIHTIALAENLLHEVLRLTQSQVATLITYDYRNQSSIYRGTWQLNRFSFQAVEIEHFERELPIYLLSLLLERKEALAWGNATDEDLGLDDQYVHIHGVKSIYGAPLITGKTLLGILILEHRSHYDYFSAEYRDLLAMFNRMATSALENALLYLSMEQQVSERAQRLLEQREQLERSARTISESLKLAKRIQESLMPTATEVHEVFPESFVLFQPQYTVSGDFYWLANVQKKQVLVCGDCSGSGVPGSFLTFIALNALNRIIKQLRIIDPARVLTELDIELKRVFSRKSSGDDQTVAQVSVSLLVIDRKHMTLDYALAHSSIYLARQGKLTRLRGDVSPVGGDDAYATSFTQHQIELQPGDRLYLPTDGLHVQHGGPEGRRFQRKRLQQTLLECQDRPLNMQMLHIVRSLSAWKGSHDQTDDLTLIGVEIQPQNTTEPN
jgi:serine phosphatase RsbU (regulator of sigma subunit)